MAEAKGIKETMELLEGLKVVALDVRKVLADGKVSLADLPVAMEILGQLRMLSEAVKGVSEIPAEVKDLSSDEIDALVAKVLEIVSAVRAA